MVRLVATYANQVLTFPLPSTQARVGSSEDNDLVLPFPGVSRHHALLRSHATGVRVSDLGSKNGLVCGDQRVEEVSLKAGDAVRLGHASLHLEEVSTSDVEVALSLDAAGTSPPSTLTVPPRVTEAAPSSPAAALHLVKLLEGTPAPERETRQREMLGSMRQVLGAETLLRFSLDPNGEMALFDSDGALPVDDALQELTEEAALLEQASGLDTALAHGPKPYLLASGHSQDSPYLAAFFAPATLPLADWQRDFFDYLTTVLVATASPSTRQQLSRPRHVLTFPSGMIQSQSRAMKSLFEHLRATVRSRLDVLLLGETGTGKELLARTIHASGPSAGGPFVAVNCAAIPAELLEADLFGVEAKAVTGVDPRPGLFVTADGGAIFLDEIGDMPERLQVKLLRVLQERQILAVGGSEPKKVQLRIIAASNQNMEVLLQEGRFRTDLYYRLCQLEFHVPPLRDCREDIPTFLLEFAHRSAMKYGQKIRGLSRRLVTRLVAYDWPGNVRQLENEMERAILLCPDGGTLQNRHFPSLATTPDVSPPPPSEPATTTSPLPASLGHDLKKRVADVERQFILDALREAGGNKTRAAELLGLTRNGLTYKLKRLGLEGHNGDASDTDQL